MREIGNARNHVIHLRLGELRENREGKAFTRERFTDRERALLVAEVGEAILQVQGDWIVYFVPDALLRQVVPQRIPVPGADHVLIENVTFRGDLR